MENSSEIKIIIAFHKEYRMPTDTMYLPLQVGAERTKLDTSEISEKFYFEKDNTGDNISYLNATFCELTGLYWAWKNLNVDYIGLVQYRRYFRGEYGKDPFSSILKYEEIKPYLGPVKVFVPKKRHYFIETIYSHYAHTHYAEHLDRTKEIIEVKYPEYMDYCEKIYRGRNAYMFNIMIMEHSLLNEYCSWLFDILFDLKDQTDLTGLSPYQSRVYGRVSEILFNVWLSYQIETGRITDNEIKEIPLVYMEKTNWWKKGTAFLKAKFWGEKYENSF